MTRTKSGFIKEDQFVTSHSDLVSEEVEEKKVEIPRPSVPPDWLSKTEDHDHIISISLRQHHPIIIIILIPESEKKQKPQDFHTRTFQIQ